MQAKILQQEPLLPLATCPEAEGDQMFVFRACFSWSLVWDPLLCEILKAKANFPSLFCPQSMHPSA